MLYPASDIDWQFDSYMIVYMLECHSPSSLVAVCRLLIAVVSLVECGLYTWELQELWPMGSVVLVHGLNCPVACGIFLDQKSNPCPLH